MPVRAYISSTFEDLKEYRRAVYAQLRKHRIDAVAMEDYVAGEQRPVDDCVRDVAECDVYIGIYAWRYGYIPRESNPGGLSITELEYAAAEERQKERLIFVLREDTPWPPKFADSFTGEGDQGRRIREFRKRVAERHGVAFFGTPDELAKEVSAAVARVEIRRLSEVRDRRSTPGTLETTLAAAAPSSPLAAVGPGLTLASMRRGLEVAGAVVRVENPGGQAFATGFLVKGTELHPRFGGELYLVTPHHIIGPDSLGLDVSDAVIRLAGRDDQSVVALHEIAWSSPVDELDVSVVRLAEQPVGVEGLTIAPARPVVSPGDVHPLFVLGYPGGRGLSFSIDGCRLIDADETALIYSAETEPGSGGSAVLDARWRVVGIHRLRGNIPRLDGPGTIAACQATSLLAVRAALRE